MGVVLQLLDRRHHHCATVQHKKRIDIQVGNYEKLFFSLCCGLLLPPLSHCCREKSCNLLRHRFHSAGGCPPPALCNPALRDCRQEHIEMQEKFDSCMLEKAKKQGCFTDRLPDGKFITIPQLANFCTKHCSLDNRLASIHECPYEGLIHTSIDPELERQFHNE